MDGLDKFLRELDRQREEAVKRWGSIASQLETDMIDAAFQWIQDNIVIKNGILQVDEDLTAKLNDLQNIIVDIAASNKDYRGTLTDFLTTMNDIRNNMVILNQQLNRINIREAVSGIQNAVIEETINRYTENGLNVHFAAPLREQVYNNAMAGQSMKDIRKNLTKYIAEGKDKSGKLDKYLTQTAQQAVDTLTGATGMKIIQEFKTVGMIISGSIIETSASQCIHAIDLARPMNGFLTNKQLEQLMDEARNNKEAKLIEGTTLANLPLNKFHWGCRHGFFPTLVAPKPNADV